MTSLQTCPDKTSLLMLLWFWLDCLPVDYQQVFAKRKTVSFPFCAVTCRSLRGITAEVNTGSHSPCSTSLLCQLADRVSNAAYVQEVCEIWLPLKGSILSFLFKSMSVLALTQAGQRIRTSHTAKVFLQSHTGMLKLNSPSTSSSSHRCFSKDAPRSSTASSSIL